MIVEKFLQFGLSEKEISVLLALMSLGSSSASAVADKAGVNRGTTYDILRALHVQGLVSHYQHDTGRGTKQYFVAEPPEKILTAIEKKISDLGSLKTSFKESLPELESLYQKSGAKPVVKYYDGIAGVRFILDDVLETMEKAQDKKYFVYSSADIREYLYKAYTNFNRDRIKHKIANQVISFGKGGELAGLDERKWMSREHGAPTYILIYAGKLAMISIASNHEPVGVIVEDQGLYETQRMIFEFTWSKL